MARRLEKKYVRRRIALLCIAVGIIAAIIWGVASILQNRAAANAILAAPRAVAEWPENTLTINEVAATRESLNQFALDSAKYVLTGIPKSENQLYSPVALYQGVAMLSEVSTKSAASEVDAAFRLDSKGRGAIARSMDDLYRKFYQKNATYTVEIATTLWLEKGTAPGEESLALLAERYHASVRLLDFSARSASKTVTKAVESTVGPLPKGWEVAENWSALLVSALTFADEWQMPFDPQQALENLFYCADGQEAKARFMVRTFDYRDYIQTDAFTASFLNYKNGCKLHLVLPAEGVLPADIAADPQLLAKAIDYSATGVDNATIRFRVPQVHIMASTNFSDPLKLLGMPQLFGANAEEGGSGVAINELKQSVSFALGTEQTAGDETGQADEALEEEILLPNVIDLNLNRPFLLAVTGPDDHILLLGIVNSPAA